MWLKRSTRGRREAGMIGEMSGCGPGHVFRERRTMASGGRQETTDWVKGSRRPCIGLSGRLASHLRVTTFRNMLEERSAAQRAGAAVISSPIAKDAESSGSPPSSASKSD